MKSRKVGLCLPIGVCLLWLISIVRFIFGFQTKWVILYYAELFPLHRLWSGFWPVPEWLFYPSYPAISVPSTVYTNFAFFKKKLSDNQSFFWGRWYPFWTSGGVCPGFQRQGGSLMLCHMHAMDSSDSPVVWHLLTSECSLRLSVSVSVLDLYGLIRLRDSPRNC